MTDLYYQRENCRLCGSKNIKLASQLEPIPIATRNFSVPGANKNEPIFREAVPLDLYLCIDCGHSQILHVGNPELQYNNYIYTTSLSLGLPEHFVKYAKNLLQGMNLAKKSLIVEFGSNDGTLLRCFKEEGMRVIGVDPAKTIANAATKSGIETHNAFFSPEVAETIKQRNGLANIIIANNVLANIDNLDPIAIAVKTLLAPNGSFVFETQYGADVYRDLLLDTIYHEHLSYFNVNPLILFFKRHGLQVSDVEHVWTKGGSIRVFVQHADTSNNVANSVLKFAAKEKAEGMETLEFYHRFSDRIEDLREQLAKIVAEQKNHNKTIGGYGMSVGTTTLLAQLGLTTKIDFLFDDDLMKERCLSGPTYDLPVFGPEEVYKKFPSIIIIFAWRYAQPIISKHSQYINAGGKFIVPLPSITVHDKVTTKN